MYTHTVNDTLICRKTVTWFIVFCRLWTLKVTFVYFCMFLYVLVVASALKLTWTN